MKNDITETLLAGLLIAFWVSLPVAWVTHIVQCIGDDRLLLMLIGAFLFPIGVIHGYGIWFGIF